MCQLLSLAHTPYAGGEQQQGYSGASGASGGGEEVQVAPLLVEGKPHLPFQLQIEYTSQDGSRCMRVITQAKPITTNRDVAEKGKTTHALRLEK